MSSLIAPRNLAEMSAAAWSARDNAHLHGKTAVGCAVLDDTGRVHAGCNVEHRFRSHCVHAEVNALSTMIAQGGVKAVAVLVAAERDRFTPCGSCMDWIFELGGEECTVVVERHSGVVLASYRAVELMPYYPIGSAQPAGGAS